MRQKIVSHEGYMGMGFKMKKKSILITAMMVSCILITIGVITSVKNQYTKDKSIISTITIENIKSMKITTPRADELEFFFDMNKEEHLEMVKKILYWLKSGKMVVNTKDHEYISHGLPPTYLIIELKDRTIIKIQSTFNGVTIHFADRNVYKAQSVDGQVTIYVGNTMDYIRELSPELKSFIDSGWKTFFDYTE